MRKELFMRQTSPLYKQLRSQMGTFYEVRVIRGPSIYGMNRLKNILLKPALFEDTGPQVGGAHSTICEMKLLESSSNWPRMASFSVEIRLTDGTISAEWISMGKFYTDERKADKYGNLAITAFDGMLLLEQPWTDKVAELPDSWPVTAKKAADMLVEATGIQIDEATLLDDTTPFVGLDTTSTARDVYKSIAAGCGGNWFMTADGKMRLVLLSNMIRGSAAIAGIAIPSVTTVGDEEINAAIGTINGVVVVGMAARKLVTATPLQQITGVEITSPEGTIAFAGSRNGYVVKAKCSFANTDIAELCLSNVEGYVYTPFEAQSARIDPAAEIGDVVGIDGDFYPIIKMEMNVAPKITANLSAPYEEEIDHEYQTMSESAKNYRKALRATEALNASLGSYIRQTAEGIYTGVSKIYQTQESANADFLSLSNNINETANSIRNDVRNGYTPITSFNTAIDNLQSQIDNSATSFVGSEVPTLQNFPANEWVTDEEKAAHIGNVYTVNQDGGEYAWYSYRFVNAGSGYAWEIISDTLASQAIAEAARAQAAAEAAQQEANDAQAAADEAQARAEEAAQAAADAEKNAAADALRKAEAARQAAITAAAADADAKATRAKADALSIAAADAIDKANAALKQANEYTDSKLQDFISGEFAKALEQLKKQIDGRAQTWYQDEDPSGTWDSRTGIAVVGVSYVGTSFVEHEGDLWYRTTDGTTWYWDSEKWVQQNVPAAVFDKIDGKAQIFISQPRPPYHTGDLWFNSETSDIMTCISARESGNYVAADWQKRNKYTDDAKANAVETDLHTNYETAIEAHAFVNTTADSIMQGVSAAYVRSEALSEALAKYSPTEAIARELAKYYNKEEINSRMDGLSSSFTQEAGEINASLTQYKEATDGTLNLLTAYIHYEILPDDDGNDVGTIVIGEVGNQTSIRITNKQIGIYYGSKKISFWNDNRQLTPSELEIPQGGKFTLGSILWQPRSTGNLSLMWVGQHGN